ncbi:MAG: hypothetical protein AAF797_12510 [Planctomycetota bacterium]
MLGWLGFGLMVIAGPLLVELSNTKPPPPGVEWRMLAFIGAYWLLTTPFGFPRWLNGYRMARRGVVVPGIVEGMTVIGAGAQRAHRLNVKYVFDGQTYKAIANPVRNNPSKGSVVLVAIRRDNPKISRVIPYDFRLDKHLITEFKKRLHTAD